MDNKTKRIRELESQLNDGLNDNERLMEIIGRLQKEINSNFFF